LAAQDLQTLSTREMNRVPSTAAVIRGASVNIVLKADQRTGRTVAGKVQDILTRGNHPRGIKVRLADGRVGRVQSMIGQDSKDQQVPQDTEADPAATAGPSAQPSRATTRVGRWQRGDRDIRLDEDELPPPTIGLDAYIKPAKTKKGATKAKSRPSLEEAVTPPDGMPSGEMAECPVCGNFKGDVAAVEHHIATHFD
jgi:uncharacterized repeat protein (TIGR03833 family)